MAATDGRTCAVCGRGLRDQMRHLHELAEGARFKLKSGDLSEFRIIEHTAASVRVAPARLPKTPTRLEAKGATWTRMAPTSQVIQLVAGA